MQWTLSYFESETVTPSRQDSDRHGYTDEASKAEMSQMRFHSREDAFQFAVENYATNTANIVVDSKNPLKNGKNLFLKCDGCRDFSINVSIFIYGVLLLS